MEIGLPLCVINCDFYGSSDVNFRYFSSKRGETRISLSENCIFHMMRLVMFFLCSATSIIIFLTYSIVFLSEDDILINTAVFRERVNWTN